MKLRYTKLSDSAKDPMKVGHDENPHLTAGINLFSNAKVRINTNSHAIVPTGIAVEIPEGYFGLLKARSGFAAMSGTIVNAGVIDSDYRGEVQVVINNPTDRIVDVSLHDGVAQMLILPVPPIELEECEDLSKTKRANQGFGSTETEER